MTTMKNQLRLASLAAALTFAACDSEETETNAAPAEKTTKAEPAKAEPAKPKVDEAAKKAKVEKALDVLMPKLYNVGTQGEGIDAVAALGPDAIEPLTDKLKLEVVSYVAAMEPFGPGKSGTQAQAKEASKHQRNVNALIGSLKKLGDDGVAAAKTVLSEIPEVHQKNVADMFRAQHQLFD